MEKTVQLYPIYDIWHQPWWQAGWFLVIVALILIVMGISILGYIITRYKRKRGEKRPWEIALMRIHELQNITSGALEISSEEVYVRVTIILKTYLCARYGFHVESKTDEELVVFLEQTSLNRDIIELVRAIVEDGVQAKFARLELLQEVIAKDLQSCTEIIKKTIPTTP